MGLDIRRLTNKERMGQVRETGVIQYAQADSDTSRAELTAGGGSAGFIMLLEAIDDVMVRLRALEAKATNSGGSGNVSRLEFENLVHQVMKLKKRVKQIRK